ncbi:MAG: hypothetical protein WD232_02080, partial [Acidimicrobiales bacterium]
MIAAAGFLVAGASSLVALRRGSTLVTATPGPNVFVNPPALIDANNSPTVARNPRRPDNLVV